jgi:outer membrane immunogenic protein
MAVKKLISAAFVLSLLSTVSHAQTGTPEAEVAAGYSALYILKGYTIWMNGASGSVAFNANHWFGVAGDFGVYHGYPAESLTGETYTFGPRFSYRKLPRLVPFAQALFGGSHFSASSGGITGGGNEFAFGLGGGADFILRRNNKFAVRPQFEYFGIRSSGSTTPSVRLSIGLVYRIGKK